MAALGASAAFAGVQAGRTALAAVAAPGAANSARAGVPWEWAVWPEEDMLRLWQLLETPSLARLSSASRLLHKQLQAPLAASRKAEGTQAAELALALQSLELTLAEAAEASRAPTLPPEVAWREAIEDLRAMEVTLHTETRYVYGPDWEVKPGKLVSKKGTWLKPDTRFSWELTEGQKLYLPQGVIMPVLQIARVIDPVELKRHEWAAQHLRVWMRPQIVRTLEARRGVWFVYWPHWEDKGLVLVATSDTWLKRATHMSGELQPFELIYVPKGLLLRLAKEAAPVDEEWEKHRHQHVHLHRKVVLASPPLTVKQDQYDIFVGQGDDRLLPLLR